VRWIFKIICPKLGIFPEAESRGEFPVVKSLQEISGKRRKYCGSDNEKLQEIVNRNASSTKSNRTHAVNEQSLHITNDIDVHAWSLHDSWSAVLDVHVIRWLYVRRLCNTPSIVATFYIYTAVSFIKSWQIFEIFFTATICWIFATKPLRRGGIFNDSFIANFQEMLRVKKESTVF